MNFSALSAAQIGLIAVAGTLAAAFISGSAAVAAAWVNGRNARALDRERALRDYRLKAVQEMVNVMEQRRIDFDILVESNPKFLNDPPSPSPFSTNVSVGIMSLTDEMREAIADFAMKDSNYWQATKNPRDVALINKAILSREAAGRVLREEMERFIFQ